MCICFQTEQEKTCTPDLRVWLRLLPNTWDFSPAGEAKPMDRPRSMSCLRFSGCFVQCVKRGVASFGKILIYLSMSFSSSFLLHLAWTFLAREQRSWWYKNSSFSPRISPFLFRCMKTSDHHHVHWLLYVHKSPHQEPTPVSGQPLVFFDWYPH